VSTASERASFSALPLACPKCRAPLPTTERGARCAACAIDFPLREDVLDLRAGPRGQAAYDPHYYASLAAVEARHYWFVARREVVLEALRDTVPDLGRRALFDVGCGSGGLLQFLGASGVPLAGACDAYPESLALVRARVEAPLLLVDEGRLPPLAPGYTLLSLFDVLEHIDDDVGTLRFLFDVLEPGGVLVLTVPAHPFLFDEMDRIAHHRRRYRRSELGGKLRDAGFRVLRLAHFMAPLVPLVVLRWLVAALPGRRGAHERRQVELAVTPVLNGLAKAVLRLERPLVRAGLLPFGSSLIAVAARPR
jgi:SAM-dependent methyltransferase